MKEHVLRLNANDYLDGSYTHGLLINKNVDVICHSYKECYDDSDSIRAGEDILAKENLSDFELSIKTFNICNKVWTVVASVEKKEMAIISNQLQRISLIGGLIIAAILVLLEE